MAEAMPDGAGKDRPNLMGVRNCKPVIRLSACFLVFSAALTPQDADDLLKHVHDALGWSGKGDSIRSLEIHGTYNGAPATIWAQRPSLFRIEIDRKKSTILESYDGSFGWRKISGRNAEAFQLKGTDLNKLIDEATNAIGGPLILAAERGSKLALEGEGTIGGTRYDKLQVTLLSGTLIHEWINAATYLPEREQILRPEPGATLVNQQLSDYRRFGGILFPCLLSSTTQDSTPLRTLKISNIVMNPALDTSIFTLR